MEDEAALSMLDSAEGCKELVSLLGEFLLGPNPEIQHKLTLFHADHYLALLSDPQQSRETKMACCSALKQALNRRGDFQAGFELVLGSVEALYLSGPEELCNSLELVLEKLFEVYLDEDKKLQAFEGVIDRLSTSNDIRAGQINERALQIAMLLARAMDPSTLNNQVCVGGLFCFLKQLYYQKHKTNQAFNPSGRGLELLLESMYSRQLQPEVQALVRVQIGVVKLIRQIITRVEEEESEEPEVVPAMYIRNSRQIEALLSLVICVTNDTRVYGVNEKINQLKSEVLELYSQNYMYRLERPFLLAAIATVTSTQPHELTDYSMQIVTSLLLLIERSTSFPDYNQCFFGVTQALVLKLFELTAAREAEKDALVNQPEHFAEIAEDFCKTQESESMKARAGSLIYNLCMYIDGNLTFVTNFALVALNDLQRRAIGAIAPDIEVRPDIAKSEQVMKTLMDLQAFGAESFTETSILVLSSISDLLAKRQQFNTAIRIHLFVMLKIFRQREKVLQFFPPIVLARYIQLISYFSGTGCLDPFVPLFSKHEGIAQCLLKGLETVIQFHDKKDYQMANYVANISATILLLPDRLTSLLESTIISRPELLQCVKERVVEKLVVWLLKYLSQANIFGCNKISNLLVKAIGYYPDFLSKVDEQVFTLDLEALAQYLSPLYRFLVSGEHREAEECVVDVAVAHAEILKTSLTVQMASDFLQLGVSVVERNSGVLNKCLELFSNLLGTVHMKHLVSQSEYAQLREVNLKVAGQLLAKAQEWIQTTEARDDNVWQLACLMELTLCTFEVTSQVVDRSFLNFAYLFNLSNQSHSKVVKIKAFNVAFLTIKLCPEPQGQSELWVNHSPLPQLLPPWEKNHIVTFILRAVCNFSQAETRARLVTYVLSLLFPNETLKKYLGAYEERIHCIGPSSDECEVMAFQTAKELRHPLECWPCDIFEEFRDMFKRMGDWEPLRQFLNRETEQKIREALEMKTVGTRLRRIVKLKQLKLN